MKKTALLLFLAALMLSSCGSTAQLGSSEKAQRFQDGIYNSSPSFRTKEEKEKSRTETDALVSKTKESVIYIMGETKDTIVVPENYSARIQFDQKAGSPTVTLYDNPYEWMRDQGNRYGYYYGPYSLGSSWWWSRHYSPFYGPYRNPYWSTWNHYPYRYYGFYDPWYYREFHRFYGYYGFYDPWYYDPWYYGGYYGSWYGDYWGGYYGSYWGGYYGSYMGWHDPWHYYHYGWYHPYPIHGPGHISGGHFEHRNYTLRANTDRTRTTGRMSPGGSSRPRLSTSGGTIRGGMSIGNTRSRSASTTRRVTGTASRPATVTRAAARPSSGSSTTVYRRPASTPTKSTEGYGSNSSSSYNRGNSPYERSSSSYDRSSSPYNRSGSDFGRSSAPGDFGRSTPSGGSSYSRGGSSGGHRR